MKERITNNESPPNPISEESGKVITSENINLKLNETSAPILILPAIDLNSKNVPLQSSPEQQLKPIEIINESNKTINNQNIKPSEQSEIKEEGFVDIPIQEETKFYNLANKIKVVEENYFEDTKSSNNEPNNYSPQKGVNSKEVKKNDKIEKIEKIEKIGGKIGKSENYYLKENNQNFQAIDTKIDNNLNIQVIPDGLQPDPPRINFPKNCWELLGSKSEIQKQDIEMPGLVQEISTIKSVSDQPSIIYNPEEGIDYQVELKGEVPPFEISDLPSNMDQFKPLKTGLNYYPSNTNE